ncbi:MAG: SRPBCC domain-containing protein [Firmicutes bacterium]|nr:SRPBCC domain-containing protein [Bacillota bacterium]
MQSTAVTVQTLVHAPLRTVWNLWTRPEHIKEWNSASDDWYTPSAQNDLRTGGRFCYTMSSRDGKNSFDFLGTYTEVIPQEKIACTLDDGRKVSIKFEPLADAVQVAETFELEHEYAPDKQQEGWQAILDHFKRYVEAR